MKLEWMGEYREVVEKLIRYCNVYVSVYNKEMDHGSDIPFSYAQIQVLEYILENEERNENMSSIAMRLGISFSTFSKLIDKLVKKGLLEKYHAQGNRKDVIIRVSDYGKKVYADYARYIYETHFSKMFEPIKDLPKEYLPMIADFLDAGRTKKEPEKEEAPVLIPIKQNNSKP